MSRVLCPVIRMASWVDLAARAVQVALAEDKQLADPPGGGEGEEGRVSLRQVELDPRQDLGDLKARG